jgi:hypothetical protein
MQLVIGMNELKGWDWIFEWTIGSWWIQYGTFSINQFALFRKPQFDVVDIESWMKNISFFTYLVRGHVVDRGGPDVRLLCIAWVQTSGHCVGHKLTGTNFVTLWGFISSLLICLWSEDARLVVRLNSIVARGIGARTASERGIISNVILSILYISINWDMGFRPRSKTRIPYTLIFVAILIIKLCDSRRRLDFPFRANRQWCPIIRKSQRKDPATKRNVSVPQHNPATLDLSRD